MSAGRHAQDYPALASFLAHTDASYHLSDLPLEEARASLLTWYAANRRRLPWRGDSPPYNGSTAGTNKPGAAGASKAAAAAPPPGGSAASVSAYGVWVSEIMCQQTRVEAVIPYWLAWMEAFPTVEALAAASEEAVNARWAGLGFYRRARMLHEGAKQVVSEHGGVLPDTVDGLLGLRGVGRYTAGAIASIVHGVPAPIVDGNVLRVFSRLAAVRRLHSFGEVGHSRSARLDIVVRRGWT
jgi:A/G-specific adenine glycosylase